VQKFHQKRPQTVENDFLNICSMLQKWKRLFSRNLQSKKCTLNRNKNICE